MKKRISVLLVFLIGFLIQSCGVNSNVMFKEAKEEVKYDSIPLNPTEDYKISIDDKITFTLTTNDGTDIIEKMSGISVEKSGSVSIVEYIVRSNWLANDDGSEKVFQLAYPNHRLSDRCTVRLITTVVNFKREF